jgi:membrane associated rhomboid family serine protease
VLIPYKADVPMQRWPIANFAIIGVTVLIHFMITNVDEDTLWLFVLDGWNPFGLFGHAFLHADFFHLFGNMIFLWVFGNAICAKYGNGKYLILYFILIFIAAAFHNIFDGDPAIGASGVVNGVVGAFLLLYPLNSISVFYWFIRLGFYSISSMWLILLWLLLDIWGALSGGSNIAYIAHLGGFIGGVAITTVALGKKVIEPNEIEMTLVQYLEQKNIWPSFLKFQEKENDSYENDDEEKVEEKENLFEPIVEEVKEVKPQVKFLSKCPSCGAKMKAMKKHLGKRIKCPGCSIPFTVKALKKKKR